MAGDLLRLCVRCDAHAPGVVRAALAELDEPGWALGDAMLVASELVTNAVRHSGCSEEDHLAVSVVAENSLRITVADPGISGDHAATGEGDVGFGGLGLRIVEQLVTAWGAHTRPEGHVVWAELAVVPAGHRAESRATSRSEEAQSPVTYADN